MTDTDMSFVQKSDKDNWQTPPRILGPIQEHDHITLDPCPGQSTEIGVFNFYPSRFNGLVVTWDVEYDGEVVALMNPPYSRPWKRRWLRKAVGEWRAGNVDRVYIVTPDSTDTKSWWHRWIVPYCNWTWFPKGRIEFIDPDEGEQKGNNSGGTAVSVLGTPPTSLLREWDETGDLVHRVSGALSP